VPNKSGTDLINEAKSRIREVSAREAQTLQQRSEGAVFLDVREPNEWNLGRIPGAVHLPRGNLETKIEQALPRDAHIIIYCASGNRSALAADTLQQMGYQNVASMAGGWRDWVGTGGQVEG
jgi:rhodanese-related sulfurtransferase